MLLFLFDGAKVNTFVYIAKHSGNFFIAFKSF